VLNSDAVSYDPTIGLELTPGAPPDDNDAWMAYSLLTRLIRLADREVAIEEMPA